MTWRKGTVATAAVLAASVAGGATSAAATAVVPPPVHARFDYQIGGAYRPASSVAIVDRDWHDNPASGRYSICYVNAFQTQAEEDAWWKRNHPHLLLRDSTGKLVYDPGWPGEILLDTSTRTRRLRLATIVGGWMDTCATKGFRGVEPDNLDSYTRSHQLLTRDDNLAYAKLLAARAHADGLAIAQKNAAGISSLARRVVGFDFAIAEECQVYQECSDYRSVYGRHVIEIEYTDNGQKAFDTACAERGNAISVVLRDRDVVPRGDSAYVEKWCP